MSTATSRNRISVLLNLLGEDVASSLLEQLPGPVSQRLQQELKQLNENPPSEDDIDDVLDEFLRVVNIASQSSTQGEGSPGSKGKGGGKSKQLSAPPIGPDESYSLEVLLDATSVQIAAALKGESPRAVAILLNAFPESRAAEVLENLADEERDPVFQQMKLRPRIAPPLVERLIDATARKAFTIDPVELEAEGEDSNARLARVLKTMRRKNREQILSSLEQRDPDAASALRMMLYTFEDLARFTDKSLQKLLASIDQQTLSSGLIRADPPILECVTRNLSKRAREVLKEEMELMGSTVDEDAIQEARKKIVVAAVELDQRGELSFKDG